MDSPLFHRSFRREVPLQSQLNELINSSLLQETHQLLTENPQLLSEEAIEVLYRWEQEATDDGDERAANAIGRHKTLLEILWPICIEAPLSILSIYKSYPELTQAFHQAGIDSIEDLKRLTRNKPVMRQKLLQTALQYLTEVDWAILLLLLRAIRDEDIWTLVEEVPFLLDNKAELSLNALIEWALKGKREKLLKGLTSGRDYLNWMREKINAEELKLHKPHIYRLVVRYVRAESWEEKRQIIEEHEHILLSDDGLTEMRSYLASTFYHFFTEGNPEPLIWSAMDLEILERCRQIGWEAVFSDKPVANLPPELWAVAGMLQSVYPNILSWSGFNTVWRENQEQIDALARLLKVILSKGGASSDEDTPSTSKDREILKRLVLIQFALRCAPTTFLAFISKETLLLENETLDLMVLLMNRAKEDDRLVSVEAVGGLWGLLKSPYRNELVVALKAINEKNLYELTPTGAHLATLVGGLALMIRAETDKDRFALANMYPGIATNKTTELANILMQNLKKDDELYKSLNHNLPLLSRVIELGPTAAFMEHVIKTDKEVANMRPEALAVMILLSSETPEQMVKIIDNYPVIPADEMLVSLSKYILSLPNKQDKELDFEEIERSKHFYAEVLSVRRKKREKDVLFQRQIPELPGNNEAARLILDLEINLLAGLWTPVSRIDLTDVFFEILNLWQQQVETRFDSYAAEPLRRVATQTRDWLAQFGEATPEHTQELAQTLLDLLDIENKSERLQFIEVHAELESQAAVDILQDWLISAQSLYLYHLADDITTLIQFLGKSQRVTSRFASFDERLGDNPEILEQIKKVVGVEGVEGVDSFTDLAELLMNLPQDRFIEISQNMQKHLEATASDDPLSFDHLRRNRLHLLKFKFQQAAQVGWDAVQHLLESEPLFFEPEAVEYIQAEFPQEYRELYAKMIQFFADPLLKALLRGNLTEEQSAELDRLNGLLSTYYFNASNWADRFRMVKTYPELLSKRILILAEMMENTILKQVASNQSAGEAGYEKSRQELLEARSFLIRCQEVPVEIAINEKAVQMAGQPINNTLLIGMDRLMSNLPPNLAEKIAEPDPVKSIQNYEQLVADATLDDKDRATLHALAGMSYKVKFETRRQLTDLNQAINAYRKSLELTEKNSLEQAIRLLWLAISLLSRFQVVGDNPRDLNEAIEALRQALTIPLLDENVKGQILGHLGMALTVRYEAFEHVADLEESINTLEEAIPITPKGTRDWIGWHINLAGAYHRHFEVFKDSESLQKSFNASKDALAEATNEPDLQQLLRHNMANLVSDMNPSLDAIDAAIEDLNAVIVEQSSHHTLPSSPYYNLGNLWIERFKLSQEKADLDQAIKAYQNELTHVVKDSPDWLLALTRLAGAFERRSEYFASSQDFTLAVTNYEKALNVPIISSWPNLYHITAENLGKLYVKRNDYAKARQAFAKAIEAVEIMRRSTSVSEEKTHYSSEHRTLYGRQVHCCLKTDHIDAALEYAVAAKGRTFVDMLASSPFEIDNPDPKLQTLLTEANNIQIRLQYLRGLVTKETLPRQREAGVPEQVDTKSILTEINNLESREASIWKHLRYEYPQHFATEFAAPISAQRAKEIACDTDATILEFYLDAGGWGVFVISPHENIPIRHIRLAQFDPPWEQWWLDMFTMYDHKFGSLNSFNGALQEMYEFFFAPIADYLPAVGSKLVLAPHGLMNIYPLATALNLDNHYLLDDYVTTVIPTLSVLDLVLGKSLSRGQSHILTVEHPGRKGGRNYLTNVSLETTIISTYFSEATQLKGESATRASIIEQALQSNIIHFSCHGIFDWQDPNSSGLMLPNGAWLTVPDVFNRVRLPNASLVVLSACEIGREHLGPGEEHTSLIRSFMYAGAPSVIAGLWSVADLSTMLLMTRFYDELLRKDHNGKISPAKALRQAQRWLRGVSREEIIITLQGYAERLSTNGATIEALKIQEKMAYVSEMGDTPFAHPFYWAAFQAVGDVL